MQKIHRFFLRVAFFFCSSCVHTYFQLSQRVVVKEAAGLGNKNGFKRIMSVISIAQSAEGWLFIFVNSFFFVFFFPKMTYGNKEISDLL